jgi:tetratricopeptide (TPR) repeat protein
VNRFGGNSNSNWGNGNWGGGRWGGSYWGGGGWGGGGWYGGNRPIVNNFYGPGWSGANWGNWYHGSSFWGGFGAGLVTSWGVNALRYPGYAYSSYAYYPSAWAAPVYGSWGLDSVASSWMYSDYTNPYITPATQTVVVSQPQPVVVAADGAAPIQPAQQLVAYDYSKPIDQTSTSPEPTAAESAQKVFESARDRFKAGDFGGALSLADQALVQLPNDSVIHEFRGLCLFALKRYDEAAAVEYAVLSAGPGWDWATLISLYSSADVYTEQLRALEAFARQKPDSAPARFLMGYLYVVQDNTAEAAREFEAVAKLQPKDALSAQLAKAFAPPTAERKQIQQALRGETPDQPATGVTPGTTPHAASAASGGANVESGGDAETHAPPPPPASMAGTWTSTPDAKVKISLVLTADGKFTWAVTEDDRTQTIQGQAGYKDDVLILGQDTGPPLTGKVVLDASKASFTFKPPGAKTAPGLSFSRQS